ncbi:PQ-loop repeat-containing protein [Aspergillus brunneoviolaceus CBS 621.78]|uniref:PQ-loop-domain-containing protein n=1 Tax=Aspergillus brunneoviolaceus CBS 621.78 TaxID=1450534 RepID=A0ACD1GH89_9EURO|nr:PQ-loop-domain-containing protein [Aspergillus brunneoviolaceus CBS 621.78]RAH48528.1 PQ-loop-domain-containing protein [Aspergillus brunneoviolaceus CBS 621.78]
MFPAQTGNINLEALSGICGSISIACWVVVFSPQIIENFRRGSADGLSLLFLIVWLAGDVFNILGAVLQGVLPTMIILAVYYTLADVVLLAQCFYYRGFTLRDEEPSPRQRASAASSIHDEEEAGDEETEVPSPVMARKPTEQTALLGSPKRRGGGPSYHASNTTSSASSVTITPYHPQDHHQRPAPLTSSRRHSSASFLHPSIDGTHLSPVTPFIEPVKEPRPPRTLTTLQTTLFHASAITLVCAAGVLGWYISQRTAQPSGDDDHHHHHDTSSASDASLEMDPLGQVFGYLCAALYLGSRLPQILLNYRRKSTDGVSLLFFLFACIGNLTYVLSILAYSPVCAADTSSPRASSPPQPSNDPRRCSPAELSTKYGQYILVNLSWLIGSFGTLLLDMCIFVQFFLYQENTSEEVSTDVSVDEDETVRG